MLDTETRRRIDTARDILVGKVPDPKSQVEQITIALIYKFMDDMDAKAEEFGGERQFFAGEFAQYGWASLMHGGLSGHDVLNMYATAITRMPENPGIPPLFRDIFNNAYLPYRDPETLRAFLKVIDEFTYDHSERLGDAFEYLLSVLGSQGDAGQFRTPRHIIDFIVAIIDPKKDETVLDPACGTAGFLISSWKQIEKAETDEKGNSTLTPDDKGRLAQNFSGYDISPDMVRLSLVNMYLHGFLQPHIHEYDTLTSEDRWNEFADVILANPPFMSPKGGIRPHNRFSVKSKRSEVLFVDYMAEHLTPEGRAGIIVPEGIIFQSQNAHRQLRRKLVEDYLVAVISLPAGVFNPYSSVKTSILILDRKLAKQTAHIAFFKVENDGFDLGAQRREIEKNDLPIVQEELCRYLEQSRSGKTAIVPESEPADNVAEQGVVYSPESFKSSLGLVVEKGRIGEDGEWNLGGERYREAKKEATHWPFVALKELCLLVRGVTYSKNDEVHEGGHCILRANNICKDTSKLDLSDIKRVSSRIEFPEEKKLRKDDIFICLASGSKDHIGKVAYINNNLDYYFGGFMGAIRVNLNSIKAAFLFRLLNQGAFKAFLNEQITGVNINNLGANLLYRFRVPVPPIEVQHKIVAEISGYQRVIDGARAVIDNYSPNVVVDPEWPLVEINKICNVNPKKAEISTLKGSTTVSFVPMSDVGENEMYFKAKDQKRLQDVGMSYTYFRENDVLVAKVTPCFENGKAGIARGLNNGIGFGSSEFYILRPGESVTPQWIYHAIASPLFRSWATPKMTGTGGLQRVPRSVLEAYQIPLPPMTIQQHILAEIEAEQSLVSANKDLIQRMQSKIKSVLDQTWGER